jgi:hypothetical protein
MAARGVPGADLRGVLRLTWAQDGLAHVLEHCGTDEPPGTWTGLACPDHGLAIGTDVDTAVLRRLADCGEIADLIWEADADLAAEHGQLFQAAIQAYNAGSSGRAEQLWQQVRAVWSRARAANCAALELMQRAGLTRFSPVKPQRWVVASFEHHCGPHGLPEPHVHNIVVPAQMGRIASDALFGGWRGRGLPAVQGVGLRSGGLAGVIATRDWPGDTCCGLRRVPGCGI